jgi:hypothetical protein
VRCATWDQVDVFTTRKLRRGKLLSLKVPFTAEHGAQVTLGLELPNEVVVAIDGVVQKSAPVEGDATRTWIEIELVGFTDDVRARIKSFQQQVEAPVAPAAPLRRSSTNIGLDQLPADERELFQRLTAELRRLRSAAVHEVLGVPRDADPDAVRRGWKELIRKHHPDLVARRNAPALTHLAEELTILANRAYDRLRAALAAEGHALLAGPALAEPRVWLVAFDDLRSGEGASAPRKTPQRFERPPTPMPVAPAPTPTGQGADFEVRARAALASGDPNAAREVLAAALVIYPRSKPLRSLYYVATALSALQDGELMLATSQLESALAHHEQCVEAQRLLDHVRKHGKADAAVVQRLFR